MSFGRVEFVWFMLAVFALYWAVPGRRWQNVVLLLASAVFYGWVHPWWLILLLASSVLDFSMGRLMVRAKAWKRLWLGLSLTGNLGMLMYFKYTNFLIDNVALAMSSLGVQANLSSLNILLPAGISFYTFQTMSYTLDIYRGELYPRKSFLDYLTFVSFFPQLVAGPVERAARLLPQLEQHRPFSLHNLQSGFGLALYGAFKKMVIADTIAPYVDKVFVLDDPEGPLIWAATTGFLLQIYADFSGYTDMARGTARMLGVDLVRNFNEPWLATTTQEAWQRWHMSLSRWIRDYVLTPLLGDPDIVTRVRLMSAITVTMVIMGAWHGAGWNFIVFGLFQSASIIFYAVADKYLPDRVRTMRYGRVIAAALHILFVGEISALIFREHSLERLFHHFTSNPLVASDDAWRASLGLLGLVVVLNIPTVIEHYAKRLVIPRIEGTVWMMPAKAWLWSLLGLLIFLFYRVNPTDFIYFQF